MTILQAKLLLFSYFSLLVILFAFDMIIIGIVLLIFLSDSLWFVLLLFSHSVLFDSVQPHDYSPISRPSVHGIFWARSLEWFVYENAIQSAYWFCVLQIKNSLMSSGFWGCLFFSLPSPWGWLQDFLYSLMSSQAMTVLLSNLDF